MGEVRKDKPIKLPPAPVAPEVETHSPIPERERSERAAIRAAIVFCMAMAAWIYFLTQ